MDTLLPLQAIAYFALFLTIISPWIKRSAWVCGPCLATALACGYAAQIIEPIALAPLLALLLLHAALKRDIRGIFRFVLVTATVGVSLGLWFHLLPGFHNVNLFKNKLIGQCTVPASLYLNFDKSFVGIFLLLLGFPLATDWKFLRTASLLTLGGICIMALLGLFSKLIAWDPKFPSIFWVFALENLVFVCIPEEAFLRGFIQNEFFRWFGQKGGVANCGSVLITALLFAALHYPWASHLPFLSLVFVAGVIYGGIYQFTRSLEASILCHWIFNLTHLLLFTYPHL